ncbi:mitotic checkpoint serine/threonine-protein kinase BUB1 [Centropristis striata]|uniref:mitotic checkpoint serine/threonine-protein kinase BUB1 n=1 Tax=Centropristis striata TaxID=184440 RepID=UPI0027DFCE78|nr:mitotic checkpoint serine/threonine-protein kinase BUB1 [Centropristis striata]
MDIASYLQCFEGNLSSYTGDDPLEPWDKFVQYLEQRSPADSSMSLVFDRLVQRFLGVEQYANDIRFVNYCIKCAGFYQDPISMYSHVYSRGVGTRSSVLYVAWAQQFEQRGMNEQAEAVYQRAMENQAQPADMVLQEHRQFQTRTGSLPAVPGSRTPLQNSSLTNQMTSHREQQNKASGDCPPKPPTHKTTIFVSRSETSGSLASSQSSGVQTVSAYLKEALLCEGSELCFEEVRAEKYFRKLREKKDLEDREKRELSLRQQEEEIQRMKRELEGVNAELQGVCWTSCSQTPSLRPSVPEPASSLVPDPPQFSSGPPPPSLRPSNRLSLGLRLHTEPPFIQETTSSFPEPPSPPPPPQQEQGALVSDGPLQPWVLADRSLLQTSTQQESLFEPPGSEDLLLLRGAQQLPQEEQLHPEEHNTSHQFAAQPAELEEKLNMSQGGTVNLSHITPNTSLGFVQATPSRVLPSPTVNTREALDVIMDMFQAPTLLDDPFSTTLGLHAAEAEADPGYTTNDVSSCTKPSTPAVFTVFQDEDTDKENGSAAAPSTLQKSKPVRALAEINVSTKTNDTAPPELTPDETLWGARYNSLHSLAACPNSTSDFALMARCVSTPSARSARTQDQENNCDVGDVEDDEGFMRRQLKKLSPIMEQSPLDETGFSQLAPSSGGHGTIVGEGLASAPPFLTSSSSITLVQPPPPAVLSFRDHTVCPSESSSVPGATAGPGWEVYTSPAAAPRPASPLGHEAEPFTIMEDVEEPEELQEPLHDVPMSPECPLKPDWLAIRSPEAPPEPDLDLDLDAFLTPRRLHRGDVVPRGPQDVPMSPQQPCRDVPMSPQQPCRDVPMSPQQHLVPEDQHMTSPDRAPRPGGAPGPLQLVEDPWDEQLISELLGSLATPLTAHTHCITWNCKLPNISPKTTIRMGKESLRVDFVLGEGAFAKVYQASDPTTSERMVLKVQKPANPWEFYIHTQLESRLRPEALRLFSSVHSAHLFTNGSVLLGSLHNYGTLLNVVNLYKTQSEKLMPQPLVLYFSVCLLHMVEQLHAVRIIHADIKPDNFLLGESFLENKCFEAENVDHGLVLIDLGQSIDMQLFPEGTAFTARCLTSGFQCTEMLSGKPWSYQTDYFGIAGTVHCLLFGTYMQVTNEGGVWKTNGVFRRNPHSELWQDFFHSLLNVASCGAPPPLAALRRRLEAELRQNYSSRLPTLKSRLVVLLLEGHRAGPRR